MTVVRQGVGFVVRLLIWSAVWAVVAAAQEVSPRNPLQPSDTSGPAATLNSSDRLLQRAGQDHQ